MSVFYHCPRGHNGEFVVMGELYELRRHSFLRWSWVTKRLAAWVVRCAHAGCAETGYVVKLRGLVPVSATAVLPGPPPVPPANAAPRDEERDKREPVPLLADAVRRPEV